MAATAAGCGHNSSAPHGAGGWSTSACRRQAGSIATDGAQVVLRFRRGSTEPPDVQYLALQMALAGFQRHRCLPQVLGGTLLQRFSSKDLRELYARLPSSVAPSLQSAVACRRGHRRSCARARPISLGKKPPGARFPLGP